jgi:hypothetical protein
MDDAEFQRGDVDITYLERAGPRLLAGGLRPELARPLAVVAALLADERRAVAAAPVAAEEPEVRLGPSAWVLAARREGLGT